MNDLSDERAQAVERPVFVVGAERSGSTMFWLMLDSHPDIAVSGEMEYVVTSLPEDGWPTTEEFLASVEFDLMFQTSGFAVDEALDYPALARSFLAQRLALGEESVAAAVIHHDYSKLLRIWPEARFIHLVRDGRDVATSAVKMGWFGNRYSGGTTWLRALDEFDRLAGEVDESRLHTVRYEDLVSEPRESLARICEFIGVEYDEAMFDYVAVTDYDFPDSSLAYQWQSLPLDREAECLDHRLAERLRQFDYPPAFDEPRPPTAREIRQLEIKNKAGRLRRRVDQFGVWPVSVEMVTRPSVASKVPGVSDLRVKALDSMMNTAKAGRKRHWDPEGPELLR